MGVGSDIYQLFIKSLSWGCTNKTQVTVLLIKHELIVKNKLQGFNIVSI